MSDGGRARAPPNPPRLFTNQRSSLTVAGLRFARAERTLTFSPLWIFITIIIFVFFFYRSNERIAAFCVSPQRGPLTSASDSYTNIFFVAAAVGRSLPRGSLDLFYYFFALLIGKECSCCPSSTLWPTSPATCRRKSSSKFIKVRRPSSLLACLPRCRPASLLPPCCHGGRSCRRQQPAGRIYSCFSLNWRH